MEPARGRLAHRARGIPFKLFFLDAPVWLSTATYLGMGYLALVAMVPLAPGGLARGACLAGRRRCGLHRRRRHLRQQRPDPFPGRFGHHEIWHLLVLAGSACHFAFMVYHVA